jgi:hypothetical protein
MRLDLILEPSQVLPFLVFFSYILLLSLTLLADGMLPRTKWNLALYLLLATLSTLSAAVSATPFLRSGCLHFGLGNLRLADSVLCADPVVFAGGGQRPSPLGAGRHLARGRHLPGHSYRFLCHPTY